ncbi:ABC transporter ATP-binding protein [Anaerococcus sp. ENR1011]|uniref:ABC transporter ATP-binding protein n=1 Tax=Anaerococcus groningensis TaxID=3115616 RepID=A0ABW9MYB7_9FIRM
MENILEVKNIEKTYPNDGFKLNKINFDVPKGSIVGIIGENGSGKTTTLNLILGLKSKDGGTVKIFGREFNIDDVDIKEKIGVSFDEIYLPSNLNAKEISKIYKSIYHGWDEKFFFSSISNFGIDNGKKIGDYSKGMQKMLSIVIAMSHSPELLILDEPTSSLDPVKRSEVLEKFQEFIENGDCSIVFSSHITTDIEHICDYVVFINKGNLIFASPTIELLYENCIARCTSESFNKLDKSSIIAYLQKNNQVVVLLKSRDDLDKSIDNSIIENPTLEEIMNIYSKGIVL